MEELEKQAQDAAQDAPTEEQTPKEVYVPRPWWQVWGARIALVAFILFLIMYYVNLLKG